jgi:hypothetical protein
MEYSIALLHHMFVEVMHGDTAYVLELYSCAVTFTLSLTVHLASRTSLNFVDVCQHSADTRHGWLQV